MLLNTNKSGIYGRMNLSWTFEFIDIVDKDTYNKYYFYYKQYNDYSFFLPRSVLIYLNYSKFYY